MNRIVDATTEKVGGKPFKIGYIVVPENLSSYYEAMEQVMYENFEFQKSNPRPPSHMVFDIVRHADAVQLVYNLTMTDNIDVPWVAGDGTGVGWPDMFEWDSPSFLLFNFEPAFLEISYKCVDFLECYGPYNRSALFHLGEKSLWRDGDAQDEWEGDASAGEVQVPLSRVHGGRVELLSSAIADFVNRTSTPFLRRRVRAALMMGGASETAMDALRHALPVALPFLEPWRIKSSIDPAFVPSLGAALGARNDRIAWYKRDCEKLYGPLKPPLS